MNYLDQFHYQISGPTLKTTSTSKEVRRWVFLHGLMGYSNNWRTIISALESSEQCLVYDQRGHGRSFKPETGYAPEDYADDLLKIIDSLGWQKIILVGHSMGARNAMNFASRFPERVEKLILEDLGPEANANSFQYYESLLNLVPTPFATRPEAKAFLLNEFVKIAKTRERVEVLAQYFYANMEEKADGTVSWKFSKEAVLESVRTGREVNRWEELKGLPMPILLIRGLQSQELSPEIYQKMLSSNKMIKGVELGPSGHWVHADQPQAFIQALKDFVGVL